MKYIISTTQQELIDLDQAILSEGKEQELFLESDLNYGAIIKHPFLDKWALPIIVQYQSLFTQDHIDSAVELDASWNPAPSSNGIQVGSIEETVANVKNALEFIRAKAATINVSDEARAKIIETINKKETQVIVALTSKFIDAVIEKVTK